MPELEDFRCFLRPLEASGLPYCVTGSVAAGVYGEPRMTADIDVVLLLRIADLALFRSIFPEDDFYMPPIEVLAMETNRAHRGMFNLIQQARLVKADIFVAARDPLHAWALKMRRRIDYEGEKIWIAPPEYVVLRKLESIREAPQHKHFRDIAFIVKTTLLDHAFFDAQLDRLGLHAQWKEAQAGVREMGDAPG
jgi:hypothetical protein